VSGASWRLWMRRIWRSLQGSGKGKTTPRRHVRPLPWLEQLEDRVVLTTPSLLSINRATPVGPGTNAASLTYSVLFNEPVTGVVPADFQVVTTGTVHALTPVAVFGSGANYAVTINGISGAGTLGLNLIYNGSIHDQTGNGLVPRNVFGTFQTPVTFGVGQAPEALVLGDFNADGNLDIAAANSFSNTVSVLMSNGNGTFQAQQTFAAGPNPFSLAEGNVNGDGKPDLVVADESSNTVSVLLGNGNGTFQAPQSLPTGSEPESVALDALSADGNLDIVVANAGTNYLSVLLGNGNGTFQSQQTFATGQEPRSIDVTDVNGDGSPDLVIGNAFSDTVSVLLGNGDGTFQAQQTFAAGGSGYSVALGDVNGDGKLDLAVANFAGGSVSILLGNGDGTFQAPMILNANANANAVAVADINGDGLPDVVLAGGYSSSQNGVVGVFLGNGNGTFQVPQEFRVSSNATQIVVGELIVDSVPDLVVPNSLSNSVSVLLGNSVGSFTGQVYNIANPAIPTHFVITGTPSSVSTGNTVTFTVTAEDQFNDTSYAYAGTVLFSSSDSAAKFAVSRAILTSGSGTFTVTLKTLGNQTLTATDSVTTSITGVSPVILVFAAASHFSIATPLFAEADAAFKFTVTALNQFNNVATAYAGTVAFTSTDQSTGTILPANQALNSGVGVFTATLTTVGSQTLTATDTNTATIFGASNAILVIQDHFVLSAPSSISAGGFLFTLTAQTSANVPDPIYIGTVHFSGSDAQGILPANATLSGGQGIFGATLKTPGTQTLTAADTVLSSIPAGTVLINVNPGAPTHYTVNAPSAATAGLGFAFTVTAFDQFNNTATGYTGTIAFTTSDHNNVIAPTLPANSTLTAGIGVFQATLSTPGSQTITVTDTTTSTITGKTGTIKVSAAAATHFSIGAPPFAEAGAAFKFTVTALDQFNNVATAYAGTVAFSSTDRGPATVIPANQLLNSGVGIFTAALTTVGSQTLTATDTNTATIIGASNIILVIQDHFVLSAPSSIVAGGFLFTLTAQTSANVPDPNYIGTVHFSSSDAQGILPANITLSGGQGIFSATLGTSGTQTLTAADTVLLSIPAGTAVISVSPGVANHFTVNAPSAATAGLGFAFTVIAFDQFNNTAVGYTGTIAFATSDHNTVVPPTLPANATLARGVGIFLATLSTAGNQAIVVTDTTTSTLTGNSGTINVIAVAASHFGIAAPLSSQAGIFFKFTVTALDQFNNVATSYTGVVTFSSSDNGSRTILPANRALSSGVGVFTANLTSAGNQTITATDANSSSLAANSPTIFISAGAATHFLVTAPSFAAVANPFSITVTSLDTFNNTATSFFGAVVFSTTDKHVGVIVPPGYVFTAADQGVHFFANGVELLTSGFQTVTCDSPIFNVMGTSNQILMGPGIPRNFTIASPPTTAGSPFTFTVTARDAFFNPTTAYTGTVAFTTSDTGAGVSLPVSASITSGVGVFTATLVTAGTQTLVATGSSGVSGSGSVVVSATTANHFIVVAPAIAVEGSVFTVSVTPADPFGNADLTYDNFVTLFDSLTNASFSRTVTNGTTLISVSLSTPGTRTWLATDTTLSGVSNVFTITAATQYVFSAPTTVTAGSAFRFTVTAQDDFGNIDTLYNSTVQFASSDSAASFVPAGVATLAGGEGVFSVTLRTAGSQTLMASDSSISGVSSPITVNPAQAASLLIIAPNTATAGASFGITVAAQDRFGNPATSYNGTIRFTSGDSAAVLPVNSSLSSGLGTFSITFLTAQTQTLTVTDLVTSSLTGKSSPIVVSPATATQFVVRASTTATAGIPFGITVTAEDPFNNIAKGYAGTIAFSSTDSIANLPPLSTLVSGVGVFSATLRTASNVTVSATDTTAPTINGTSNSVKVSAAPASHFAITLPPVATAGSGVAFTVMAEDPFNNLATAYSGTVVFSSTDSAASLPTASPLNGGVGKFTVTFKTAANQVLTVSDKNTNTISGQSGTIAVSAAAATHFVFATPPAATAGSIFAFTVLAEDPFNNVATSYHGTVAFASSDSGATLSSISALSSGVGNFSATLVTAGGITLSATDINNSTLAGVSGAISVVGAAATHFTVGTPVAVSAAIGFAVTVQALDRFNNLASSYGGTVMFSSSDGAAFLPANATLAGGIGVFSATLVTLGSQTLTATDTTLSSVIGTSNAIQVNRPPATHFGISVPSNSITAGNSFKLTVIALDVFNNTAVDYAGSVTFTSSDNGATLPENVTLTSGVGVFSATAVSAGSQFLTASDSVSASVLGSATVNVIAAAATQFAISAPSDAIAGTAFAFVVIAEDPFGNTAVSYTGTVVMTTSDTAPGAAAPAPSKLQNGVGTFSATLVTVGAQNITATDAVNPSITGSTTVVVPVTVFIPHLDTGRGVTLVVPIEVNALLDPLSPLQQSGLSGGTFVINYNPSVFTVSEGDVDLGTISSPSASDPSGTAPGDGYAPNPADLANGPNNGWVVNVLPSSGPGELIVTLANLGFGFNNQVVPLTGTGGGSLVTINFHVLTNARLGPSVIDLAADADGPGSLPVTAISDAIDTASADQPYNLIPAPQDNTVLNPSYSITGSDPVDGIVEITGLNEPPVAANDSYSITERAFASDPSLAPPTSMGVLANDFDPQNIPLTAVLLSRPSHGSLTLNGDGSFIYTPNTGYLGPDSFTYQASNGFLSSQVATVSLMVTARLSIPTNIAGQQGGVVTVPVNIDNPNPVGSGGLVVAALAIDYDPAVFTVGIPDINAGTADTGAQVIPSVNPVTGQIGIGLLSAVPDTSTIGGSLILITFHINANAPTGPSPIYLVPSNTPGSLTVTTGLTGKNASYPFAPRPLVSNSPNVPGVDGSVIVSGPATHLGVTCPSGVTAGSGFLFTVTALDIGNFAATSYSGTVDFTSSDGLAKLPASGTLSNGVGVFSATLFTGPSQTLTAIDSVTSTLAGSTAVIINAAAASQFVVTAPTDAISKIGFNVTVTAFDPYGNIATGYTGTVEFTSSDQDPRALLSAGGTLQNGVGSFSATLVTVGDQVLSVADSQTPSINGSTNIIVPVTLSIPSSSTGRGVVLTVPININALDDPVSVLQQSGLSGGTIVVDYNPSVFTVSASDLQLGTISTPTSTDPTGTGPGDGYAPNPTNIINGPNNGWVVKLLPSVIPGQLIISLVNLGAERTTGAVALTGTGGGSLVTVNFHVLTNAPLGPSVIDLAADVSGPGSLPVTALSDANDISGALQPYNLIPALQDNTTELPTYSYSGFDSLDSVINVTGTNLRPIASNDSYSITERALASDPSLAPSANSGVLANDFDPQNIPLTTILVSPPSHGSLTLNTDGSFVYTPNTGYLGTDSFTYFASDGFHNSNLAAVSLTVTARLSIPTNLIGAPGEAITVPVNIDNPNPVGSGGLVGAELAIDYDPTVLTFVSADVGAAYPTAGGWDLVSTVNPSSGLIGITLLNTSGIPNASTAGGNLVLITFDINAGAANGLTPIYLVPANTPGSITVATGLTAKNSSYNMPLRPLLANPPTFVTGVDGNVTVTSDLVISGFAPTPTGFTVTFNRAINPDAVVLYTSGSLQDDVILATTNSQVSVRGSILMNATDTGFTFVKTNTISGRGTFNPANGLLAAGNYTLTLRSFSPATAMGLGGTGFEDLLGNSLDGAGNGTPGTNFVTTFTVSPQPVAVGIPDFARGPSNTDAIFLPGPGVSGIGLTNGSTFSLMYTNPLATPSTGTAIITFSTTAATLQNNIQTALNNGGLTAQVGVNTAGNNLPNATVVVTNDVSSGANVLVTFSNALANATNQLLGSSTPGVTIALATINVANNIPGNGIPIALSSGLGVTSGSFTLQYNPALLSIGGAVSQVAGGSFTLVSNDTVGGTAVLSFSSPTSIGSTSRPITLGSLLATVPMTATATYGAIQLLHFSSEQLDGSAGPITVTGQDGVQVAAYLGDVTDSGSPLSFADYTQVRAVANTIANTIVQTIPGFAAFPDLDPAIIGDVSLQGYVNSTAAGVMFQELNGTLRITIPYAPSGLSLTPAPTLAVVAGPTPAAAGAALASSDVNANPLSLPLVPQAVEIGRPTSVITQSATTVNPVNVNSGQTTSSGQTIPAALPQTSGALQLSTTSWAQPTDNFLDYAEVFFAMDVELGRLFRMRDSK
jgi:hypothetical protein